MSRDRLLLGLGVLLAACGCPTQDDPPTGPGPAATASPSSSSPTPSAAPSATPGGMVGPFGPARPRTPDPDDGVPQTDLLPTRVLQVGGAKLIAWVADQEDSRRLGLMHVRSIPDDHGMLFVYPRAGRRSFWMRNTHVPLSLAYVAADGTIEQLVDMQPLDLTSHPSRTSVRLVLEVNQGWFRRNAVEVGTKIPGITELVGYE